MSMKEKPMQGTFERINICDMYEKLMPSFYVLHVIVRIQFYSPKDLNSKVNLPWKRNGGMAQISYTLLWAGS